MQVTGKELFGLLREMHGKRFQTFIQEKIVPLAGDIIYENLGVEGPELREMTQELNVIVNGAATTNFYERLLIKEFSVEAAGFISLEHPQCLQRLTALIIIIITTLQCVKVRRGSGCECHGGKAHVPAG
jgi:hypothetical protein